MSTSIATVSKELPPPAERNTVLGWLRRNLFSTWYNALLTIVMLVVIAWAVRGLIVWALETARWEVVITNFRLFMVGQYPLNELWRIWVVLILFAALSGLSWGVWLRQVRGMGVGLAASPFVLALVAPVSPPSRVWLALAGVAGIVGYFAGRAWPQALRRLALVAWVLLGPLAIVMIAGLGGQDGLLRNVPSSLWGGLLLTLLLAVVGIVFSFPLGILLALGRQSRLPIVSGFCVMFIEVVRGVPFVSILFMAQLMLPLFLPQGVTVDRVVRAMAGIILFTSAYMAENVRGGLQSIPRGQYEAAQALGLGGAQTLLLIILPQALRAVIPIIVGQFIALFKDTSLVVIVGLLELMGIAKTVLAQPDFLGLQIEVYVFVALVYGVFCYLMSNASQRVETSLGVGNR
jgi:general L-amino acid transport system permease protein